MSQVIPAFAWEAEKNHKITSGRIGGVQAEI
jgi:hypothetical protein